MQIQLVAKRLEKAYEAALFVDTRFKGVDADEQLVNIVNTMLGPYLNREAQPGTEVVINIAIATPEELVQAEKDAETARIMAARRSGR